MPLISAGGQQRALPRVECTLADVEALMAHVEKAPDAWRKAVGGACSALHGAIARVRISGPPTSVAARAVLPHVLKSSSPGYMNPVNIPFLGAGTPSPKSVPL